MKKSSSATLESKRRDVIEFKQSQYVISLPQDYSSATDHRNNDSKVSTLDGLPYDYIFCIIEAHYPSFKNEMLLSIRTSVVESGVVCEYEYLFDEYVDRIGIYASSFLLNMLLKEYFDDIQIVKAILHLISHRTYDEFGDMMSFQVISAVYHNDKRIKKFALKVIDNWDSVEMLPLLKGTSPIKEHWLNNYKNRIVLRLEDKKKNALPSASNQ